jgi:hypothetical protein
VGAEQPRGAHDGGPASGSRCPSSSP